MHVVKACKCARRTSMVTAAVFAFFGLAVVAIAGDTASRDIVTAFSEFKFLEKEVMFGSTAISSVLLREDPQTGRATVLTKLTRGTTRKHFHTFDEEVFLVRGTLIHVVETLPETRTKKLEAGSYWYVPAGSVHQDTCLSDVCEHFVLIGGEGDTKMVDEPR